MERGGVRSAAAQLPLFQALVSSQTDSRRHSKRALTSSGIAEPRMPFRACESRTVHTRFSEHSAAGISRL